MAWEVHFKYYEKNKESKGYDTENPKTFKKQVGKIEEETSLEKVASEIVKQMARRDVFVEVEEIFEYTKKPVNFKEAKGGIVIKGQKFNLDGMAVEAEKVAEPIQNTTPGGLIIPSFGNPLQDVAPIKSLQEKLGFSQRQESVTTPPINNDMKVLRMEIFDPSDAHIVIAKLKEKGMTFTVGKKYPIYKEYLKEINFNRQSIQGEDAGGLGVSSSSEAGAMFMYTTTDDNGRTCNNLLSSFFRLPTPGLSHMPANMNQFQGQPQPRLLHMNRGPINVHNDNGQAMPDLSRRRR